ncbi:hypothetical protein BJ322DRAFT_1005807 [Thelephora terrestris]|uniref:Uncharacterized protein n=1 Tax=Thelephora terrestris TaxID=56493 RepID=A0A9P6HEC4_9AGAM|nr:hypothetical protein BJ322DRAFT_1005807 [Thelephora terrestris]
MTHISPAVYGLWAIMSVLLAAFCAYHLWHYDRFRCLRWDNPRSGVFKRFMTYTYILSLPTLATYTIGNAAIKYTEGYIYLPGHGIIPTPYQLWPEAHLRSIFPLTMTLSIAWALEMITHLEELCFWLFLTNTRTVQQNWFKSKFFYVWAIGSVCAITYMPAITAASRDDPLKCEAWTFLGGSIGSLTLTILFMPVLFIFPSFLRNLESQGVDQATVVRLTGFQELNRVRVVFRFMFTLPILILGADGVRGHHHVNESMFWTDFLAMVGAFGCCVSSALTLVIFFPRSAVTEYIATRSRHRAASTIAAQTMDLREEPRRYIASQSSMSPMSPTSPKAMVFTSEEDEPPLYFNNFPPRALDQPSLSRIDRDSNWRNFNRVRSPSPSFSRDSSPPPMMTKEIPLRPNRREDIEFGREDFYTPQVLLSDTKPRRKKSSGGDSGKNWLKNIRSPIGELRQCCSCLHFPYRGLL